VDEEEEADESDVAAVEDEEDASSDEEEEAQESVQDDDVAVATHSATTKTSTPVRDPAKENVTSSNKAAIVLAGRVKINALRLTFPPKIYEYKKKGSAEKAVRKVSFDPQILNTFSWLEYSISSDKVFCFACRTDASSRRDSPYVSGTSPWNDLSRKLNIHATSRHHQQCVEALRAFEKREAVGVQASLGGQSRLHASVMEGVRAENRCQLGNVFDIVKFLGRLGLPFRGHDESVESLNRGCFLEIREFSMAGRPDFREWVNKRPKNATYMSPEVQNDMIDIVGKAVVATIVGEINGSGAYSIMVDETMDVSKVEQVSFCVRYVDACGVIRERLLDMLGIHSTKAGFRLVIWSVSPTMAHQQCQVT
jgi:hypothetical protein